ncbi:SDR family NAD(P)-dependent oxidoreductase [Lentzea flaviverrucosa]|uniref:NAD(P)-dependent dehydrogenase, short-chain alcohol dehydrogenase family n=1 Tax=Lentzea flaviverrucosa TaxID=200379 RepID=A0A1H9JXC2_9PSEU|nr:SDR family oxidoreductase [Lentzea flaviverrucosa]RDI26666.1 NAD(P)-dependent dehydrogenase (short-subunit alcohol dehydrogenase family) [Lentzea flaviverrucosa]SEQ91424.1 NAD(P)-dependent dehydrogenase, short-chain alcohol dehydrogenase family [Lentzea flaviverrucosa]
MTSKVAIVTGASQGIGAALVPAYRKLGYSVVAVSRSIEDSDDPEVLAIRADLSKTGEGARVVQETQARFGRVDSLVNNAGIFVAKPFTEYTDEDFATVTGTNLVGFFDITRSAVKAMEASGGHVVNVSTSLVDHALSAVPSALASLTKGGLNAVTKSLAVEYAARDIRFNTVALGIIKTPMHAPETHEALAGLHPAGRIGEISEVVDAITFLEQAGFVTGEVLHVDGGQSAGH